MTGRDGTAVLALVAIGLTLIMLVGAVLDGIRGKRSWREWWNSLR
jgi:hypothetical protein